MRRYKRIRATIEVLDRQYSHYIAEQKELPRELILKRNDLMREMAEQFPDEERWLLPTSFGNAVRAFEGLSRPR